MPDVLPTCRDDCKAGAPHCYGRTDVSFFVDGGDPSRRDDGGDPSRRDDAAAAAAIRERAADNSATRARCTEHPDDSDDCVYKNACLDLATNRLALVIEDDDPRLATPPDAVWLRVDGLTQIPASSDVPLPHRGFAVATYISRTIRRRSFAKFLPGWTALVYGDGPQNVRHQAKYVRAARV